MHHPVVGAHCALAPELLYSARKEFILPEDAEEDEDSDEDGSVSNWLTNYSDTQLSEKFSDKWDAARSAYKKYKVKCDKSGAAKAKKGRILELSSSFFEWCGTQPDLALASLQVRPCSGSSLSACDH
jgi:hypothetical protein